MFIKPETSDAEEAPAVDTSEIGVGDVVAIKNNATHCYPGGEQISALDILNWNHKVTQVEENGKPVIRGGVECVLLGVRKAKIRGTESKGLDQWVDKSSLIIIRKGKA